MTLSPVTGFAAVNTQGKDLLFYTQSDGTISFWESQNPNEANDRNKYHSQDIVVNDNTLTAEASVPLIAAVAYEDPYLSGPQIRVYYVSAGRKLREVCRSGNSDWFEGNSFINNQWTLAEGSGLSANTTSGEQLKVYYNDKDSGPGKTSIVYSNLGQGNWSRRLHMN